MTIASGWMSASRRARRLRHGRDRRPATGRPARRRSRAHHGTAGRREEYRGRVVRAAGLRAAEPRRGRRLARRPAPGARSGDRVRRVAHRARQHLHHAQTRAPVLAAAARHGLPVRGVWLETTHRGRAGQRRPAHGRRSTADCSHPRRCAPSKRDVTRSGRACSSAISVSWSRRSSTRASRRSTSCPSSESGMRTWSTRRWSSGAMASCDAAALAAHAGVR